MTELPPKATGTAPIVRAFNQLRQCVLERSLLRDENFHADYQTNGFRIIPKFGRGKASEPSDLEVGAFVIKSIAADWLVCMPYDTADVTPPATVTASLVKVARNYRNRTTGFDGATVNGKSFRYHTAAYNWSRRKASQGGVEQMEVIVPPYYVNAIIYAKRGMTGGTHVYDALTVPATPVLLEWIDCNDDARAWAKAKDDLDADDALVI